LLLLFENQVIIKGNMDDSGKLAILFGLNFIITGGV